ncbi:isoleucyl-trna synthetase [Vairimorpha apis BRL 01]|uniref:Isoleucyl-trna synthetase n=1 Tax=Vairimorpha apis BRL 01 TaxID=1037528 RepID=T0MKK2_9MICR|nr:isoleucyl-trna synthetase [Vairimorpha apis BRL 01]
MLTKLAIITDDINSLVDVISSTIKSNKIKNVQHILNKELYNILNRDFDVRFVDLNYVFKIEEDYYFKSFEKSTKINFKIKKESESENLKWLNIYDQRFKNLYIDSDYYIDVSHNEYKKKWIFKILCKK